MMFLPNAEEEAKSETSQRKPLLVEAGRDRADEKVPSSSAETLYGAMLHPTTFARF